MSGTSRTLPGRALRMLLLWPIFLLWRMVTALFNALGIIFSIILAIALSGAGYLLIPTFLVISVVLPLLIFCAFAKISPAPHLGPG